MLNRRNFLAGSAAAAAALPAAAQKTQKQYIEMRFYDVHNDGSNQRRRLTEFLEKAHLPMMKRRGVQVGYFQISLGEDMPRLVTLAAWPSFASIESVHNVLAEDKDWLAARKKYSDAGPLFDRTETWLMQAFDGMPKLEAPKLVEGKKPRTFVLRIYESVSFEAHLRKVDMFNSGGEIDIFRRAGLDPVFFGRTIYGGRMPNLVYMVAFDDMAAHDAGWAKFRADPDWAKISKDPKWAGTVSNISNIVLSPLSFSPIR
jgi:NIPSNAP protein